MKVLFYSSDEKGGGLKVQDLVTAKIPRECLEIYRSIRELSNRLRYRSQDVAAAVLVATGTEDLKSLVSIRNLLENIRNILILPNSDQRNISLGHSLYPRFIGFADGSLDDIAAVINNVFGNAFNRGMGSI